MIRRLLDTLAPHARYRGPSWESDAVAWGAYDRATGHVRAYQSSRKAYEAVLPTLEDIDTMLRIVYYHPDHDWVEWATGRRVRDGRTLRRLP